MIQIIEQPWDVEMVLCRMISNFIRDNLNRPSSYIEREFNPTMILGYLKKNCVHFFMNPERTNVDCVLICYPTSHRKENPYNGKIVKVKGGEYLYIVTLVLSKAIRGRYVECIKPPVLEVIKRFYPETNWIIAHRGNNAKEFIKDMRKILGKHTIGKVAL